MVKKIRFQESRSTAKRRRSDPRERWVLEPQDAVLIAVAMAALVWLQLMAPSLPI